MKKDITLDANAIKARAYIAKMERGELGLGEETPQHFGAWQELANALNDSYQTGYTHQDIVGAKSFVETAVYIAQQEDAKVKYLMELPFDASEHLEWTSEEIRTHEIVNSALNGGLNLLAPDTLIKEFPLYNPVIEPIIKARILEGQGAARIAYNEQCKLVPRLQTIVENEPQNTSFQAYEDDYFESLPKRDFLLYGIVPEKSLVVVFGPPKDGKSLAVMAWSMCVASGTQWLGRAVKQGAVAYIVGEGEYGVNARIQAWKYQNNYTGNSGVKWIPQAVLLNESATVDTFMPRLKAQLGNTKPSMIVFDTLARCSVGSEENSTKDMSIVIRSVDRIKAEFGCTIVLVHHDGKENGIRTARTPRGAQAVTGAGDSLIHIGPTNEGCKVHCEYVKDYKRFPDVPLAMKTLNFSADEYDTGAYLIHGNDTAQEELLPVQKTLLAIIGDKTMRNRDIQAICMRDPHGILEKTMNTHLKILVARGLLEKPPNEKGYRKPTTGSDARSSEPELPFTEDDV